MVSHTEIQASNAQVVESTSPRFAVFVGGTSGIGKATVAALVSSGSPIRLYIIGRNKDSRSAWLEELRKSNAKAEIVWLEGQVTLLAEAKRLSDEIKSREKSIDLLFLSAGFLPFSGRNETSEGLETSLALLYWTRMLFVTELLPLLAAPSSVRPTYSPRVISIVGTGFEDPDFPLDDLDLRHSTIFSTIQVARQASTLTTLFLNHLATETANKNIVFIHNHPGGVKTEIYKNGWNGKPIDLTRVPPPVLNGIEPEVAGERCLYLITSAHFGGKGVPLEKGVSGGLTITKKESSALFCVSADIECIQLDAVLEKLGERNADAIVWEKTQKVLAPYV